MSKRDQALYELANLAVSDKLDDAVHPSIDAVAGRIGLSRSTVGRAVQHLCDRGAAEWTEGSRELILCSKERAIDIYKTTWDRKQSLIGHITEASAARLVESGDAVWGGHKASIKHMDYVAAYPNTATVYVTDPSVITTLDDGDIPVYRWVTDTLPEGGYATAAQTLTELFNTPGFVSGEFYSEMWDRLIRQEW